MHDIIVCRNMYSEFLLICHNLFLKTRWINEFGGLTEFSLELLHYIGAGNCGGLNGLADEFTYVKLTGIHCTHVHTHIRSVQMCRYTYVWMPWTDIHT